MRLSIFLFLLLCNSVFAQIGGRSTYQFMTLSNQARVSALGGYSLFMADSDLVSSFQNPASITSATEHQLSMSYLMLPAGIKSANALYGFKWKEKAFVGGLQFLDYGSFDRTNESGEVLGTFRASEFLVSLGHAYQYNDRVRFGGNAKLIGSMLEFYQSYGLALDMSGTYKNEEKNFQVAFAAVNMGSPIKQYVAGNVEPLPFNLLGSYSQRLKHLPLTYTFTLHHLHQWNIRYFDINDKNYANNLLVLGETTSTKNNSGWIDNAFQHLATSIELAPSKSFKLRFGYNHMQRKEGGIPLKTGSSGFSWGFGFRIKKLNIDYGSAAINMPYHTNSITLGLKINEL